MTNERTCQLCMKPLNVETQKAGRIPDPTTNLTVLAHLDCIMQLDKLMSDIAQGKDTVSHVHKSYHPTSTLDTCDICRTPLLPGQETLTVNRGIGPITVHQACYADDLNNFPNARGVPGISREAAQKLGYRGAE